eukprot:gene16996-14056_t
MVWERRATQGIYYLAHGTEWCKHRRKTDCDVWLAGKDKAAGKETANGGTAAGIEVETTNAAPATADSAQLAPDPTAAARASAQAVSESEDEVVEIKRQHMGGDAEEASDPSRINRLTPGTTDSAVGCKTVDGVTEPSLHLEDFDECDGWPSSSASASYAYDGNGSV